MTSTDLLTIEDLLGDISPERQAAWERPAPARAVANALVAYRGHHGLSQRALAAQLGVRPSVVGRLELAEHNPTIETLQRLSHALGLRFALEVVPPGREPQYLGNQSPAAPAQAPTGSARVFAAAAA
jgi:transcriptional regulator with XRE-family HTH domain